MPNHFNGATRSDAAIPPNRAFRHFVDRAVRGAPGWTSLVSTARRDLAAVGARVVFRIVWRHAQLGWVLAAPLSRSAQRALLTAAASALETCQACAGHREWSEPTTTLPQHLVNAPGGLVRLRLCTACRLDSRDLGHLVDVLAGRIAP